MIPTKEGKALEVGAIIYCKLTSKKMIVQEVIYAVNSNIQYVQNEKKVSKYLCRFWSQSQDRFFTCFIMPGEFTLNKPDFHKPIIKNKNERNRPEVKAA